MRILALLLWAVALPAWADTPMTGAEFEAYTTGRTITFSDTLGPYGAEQYKSGRRVSWSLLDGDCLDGTWHASGDEICFDYGRDMPLQCWHFFRGTSGIWARITSSDSGFVLYEHSTTDEPLYCKGPLVGS